MIKWPFAPKSPPKPTTESLLQEQNQLLRELIHATTGAQATTPSARVDQPPRRKLDARSVTQHTRETIALLDREAAQRAQTSQSQISLGGASLSPDLAEASAWTSGIEFPSAGDPDQR